MTRPKRERISVRLEAEVKSFEGRLLSYLKSDPILPPRDALLRALKAFYMPWAMEEQLGEAELKSLARTAVEELQFRIFQIQQRYLLGDSPAYVIPNAKHSTVGAPSSAPSQSNGQPPQTIAEMRQKINPAELDDF
ncbi:MAG: hypothetical protein MJA27_28820 [Pseudanabaenales cyanobacterium]|nr:hypothetical protein [Pseudanabaenales cyanobacterium]